MYKVEFNKGWYTSLIYMCKLEADDADDDERDGDEADKVVWVAEEYDPRDNGACGSDTCPHGVSSSDGNTFHRLRDGKETEYYEDNGDNARDNLWKSLAEFECNCKTDLKKSS